MLKNDLHAFADMGANEGGHSISASISQAIIEWLRAYAPHNINSFEMDERRTVPPHVYNDMANMGMFGLTSPRSLGGQELNWVDSYRVLEQLAAVDPAVALFVGLHLALGVDTLVKHANPELRDRLVPDLASGRKIASFAITEPGAGSNPRAITTTAVESDEGVWHLTGQKSWIGAGAWASVVIVICKLRHADGRGGFGACVVERGDPGYHVGPEALTLGMRAVPQSTLYFDNVVIKENAWLGDGVDGLELAYDTLKTGRFGLSVIALGVMKRCATLMVRYAERRRVAGGTLLKNAISRRRIQSLLGRIHAVELFTQEVATLMDRNALISEDLFSVLKLTYPEYIWSATDDLVQMYGGRGYEEVNEASRLLRDARIFRIFEGPTEAVGVHLGGRLFYGQADLFDSLSKRECTEDLVARLESLVMAAKSSQSQGRVSEEKLLALGQAAAAVVLIAFVRDKNGNNWTAKFAEADLQDDVLQAERRLLNDQELVDTATLSRLVAEYADTAGHIDQNAASPSRQPDVYVRSEMTEPIIGEDHVKRTLRVLGIHITSWH